MTLGESLRVTHRCVKRVSNLDGLADDPPQVLIGADLDIGALLARRVSS